jgi:hypothetical protein
METKNEFEKINKNVTETIEKLFYIFIPLKNLIA